MSSAVTNANHRPRPVIPPPRSTMVKLRPAVESAPTSWYPTAVTVMTVM